MPNQIAYCDICEEAYPLEEGWLRAVSYDDSFELMVCIGDRHTEAQIQEEIARTLAAAEQLRRDRDDNQKAS